MKSTLFNFILSLGFLAGFIVVIPFKSIAQTGGGAPQIGTMTTSGEGAGKIQMNGAMGATVINGVGYQFFSLRPDIPIWKFGIGLDLSFYFDADGNLREEDWDETADFIEKIYYLRYGKPGEPLYIRAGSLDPVTLGYGLIMRRYSNAIEWPQVRRIGLHFQLNRGAYHFEGLINNFRELDSPGLLAGRVTYKLPLPLPIVVGASIVHDGNQYLGARDSDDDGIPDRVDQFPDRNDGSHINWLRGLLSPQQIIELIQSGDLPDINNPPNSISDLKAPFTEHGVDVGLPLYRGGRAELWAYAQGAKMNGYGTGFTVPGLTLRLPPFYAGVEYRIFQAKFIGDFFDLTYETDRVIWSEAANSYITKSNRLADIPAANGIYADAGANILNLIDLFASYQHMFYDNGQANRSLYASATLSAKVIPKLDFVQGYYQQPNAESPFRDKPDGTVVGWRVGAGLGGGVMLVYDTKNIYHNGRPTRVMTVETVVRFN